MAARSKTSGRSGKSSGTRKRSTSSKKSVQRINSGIADEVLLVMAFAFCVLLFLSTFGLLGNIGKFLGSILFGIFGMVAYLFPFFLAFSLFFIIVNKGKKIANIKIGSAILFVLMLCCICHLIFGRNVGLINGQNITYFYTVKDETHLTGGFLGGVISYVLKKFLGTFGAYIVVITLLIISGVLFTERSLIKTVKRSSENLMDDARRMKEYRSKRAEVYQLEKEERSQRAQLRDEERAIARAKRIKEQDAKREANLNLRRQRAEEARRKREENAQKAREEARVQYLNEQAQIALKQKEEEANRKIAEIKSSMNIMDVNDDTQSDINSSVDVDNLINFNNDNDLNAHIIDDTPVIEDTPAIDDIQNNNVIPSGPVPQIMSFGPRDDSKKRIDNKVSGLGNNNLFFDLSATSGEMREVTPVYEGEYVGFDDNLYHAEHKINISNDTEEYTDDYIDNTSNKIFEEVTNNGVNPEIKLFNNDYELPFVEKTVERSLASTVNSAISAADGAQALIDAVSDSDNAIASNKPIEYKPIKTETVLATEDKQSPVKPAAIKNTEKKIAKNNSYDDFKLPPVTLLNEIKASNASKASDELSRTGERLKEILKTFGVNVTISGASRGPSVTRYEIQPEIGTKVSKVVSLTDDIKMALAATDIRMEAPIPGKSAIGIEIPNKETSAVAYRELVESNAFKDASSKITFAVGKDLNGQVVVTDINKLPHVLIAGATGSGKSVCINTLIMSILYKARPDEVKLIMIDPKVVELSVYNDIPHLLLPVVTDPKKASASLAWAVNEMMRRYQCFEALQVRNIEGYNSIIQDNPEYLESGEHHKMPQIVIIVDELADLMMVASKEVEESICRLAQLARAAGIHLVLATQRPSVNVVTGLIKANMPSRIAFAVSSGIDSRTILDMVGAEKLLGKGDMLFYPQNFTKPARVQGAFVSDDEVKRVVDFLKAQNNGSPYDETAKIQVENGGQQSAGFAAPEADNGFDPLFFEAGKSIIEKQKASIGMLQRIHKIGFNRAARIMDQLSDAGVVGPDEGTKARSILMTLDEFEMFIKEREQ